MPSAASSRRGRCLKERLGVKGSQMDSRSLGRIADGLAGTCSISACGGALMANYITPNPPLEGGSILRSLGEGGSGRGGIALKTSLPHENKGRGERIRA